MNLVTPGSDGAPCVLVTVSGAQGSVPREPGAWMLVFDHGTEGTVGGGHLELQAIAAARQMLHSETAVTSALRFTLGASLGQCCGGVVELALQRLSSAQLDSMRGQLCPPGVPVALFGGGHVGTAIVQALAPLPFNVRWIDSRDEIFPASLPQGATCEHSDPVHAAVDDLAAGSMVLVMSFSHAEDLDVVAACLQRLRKRDDLPLIGLIGSKTKWATFRHRLEARGFTHNELARITSPIGIDGIRGKQPAVIAASVAAQLLLRL